MIAATIDWKLLLAIALLVGLGMVLGYRLLNRDSQIRRTRYGFFVERDRFEEDEGWTDIPIERTLSERTVELPPKEEK